VRRERTYSDPRIIALLNECFIPAAVNINGLQRQNDDEGRFFRLISWQGRFRLSFAEAQARVDQTDHGECHQGQFAATIDGELLGSRHTADPDELLAMLHTALENWETRTTQRERVGLGEVDRDTRYQWIYPEDGLVLHQGCTDLPRQVDTRSDWQRRAHNQDFVWLTREEMLSIVPESAKTGDVFPLPEAIHRRLVRYHMLDIVRGETSPWSKTAPDDVALSLTVTDATPDRVLLTLSGGGCLRERGSWCIKPPRTSVYKQDEMCCLLDERGFEMAALGYLAFDRKNGRFSRFDVLIAGTRWGGTTFNVRSEDVEPAPMGIAFTIAGRGPFERIPPHGTPGGYFNA